MRTIYPRYLSFLFNILKNLRKTPQSHARLVKKLRKYLKSSEPDDSVFKDALSLLESDPKAVVVANCKGSDYCC